MAINAPDDVNEYGLLSAIWILSCNDENPMMTYKFINYRLGLEDENATKSLIKKRSELFRTGVPRWRLVAWKEKMLSGQKIPVWIRQLPKEKWEATINALTTDDVFRSQFRATKDSEKSPVELINWGLEHLERLRKAEFEQKDIKLKWFREVVIPFVSIIIALLTILATSYFQYENIQTQKKLKEYELSFKPKQDGYTNFMRAINTAFDIAIKNSSIPAPAKNDDVLSSQFRQVETAYYSIEPFLGENSRDTVWENFQKFQEVIDQISSRGNDLPKEEFRKCVEEIIELKSFFRNELKRELLNKSVSS